MKYRKVDTRIWIDEKFRALTDDGKLAFLFLLTHPRMTCVGAMHGTVAGVGAELGWTIRRVTVALAPAIRAGMVQVNHEASFVGLPNFLRYNDPDSPNAIAKSWLDAFDLVPECHERQELIRRCASYLNGKGESFLRTLGRQFLHEFVVTGRGAIALRQPDGSGEPSGDISGEPSSEPSVDISAEPSGEGSAEGCTEPSDIQEQEQEQERGRVLVLLPSVAGPGLAPSLGISRKPGKDRPQEHPGESIRGSPVEPDWGRPEDLVALYNAAAPHECPAVEVLSPARRKKALAYLAIFPRKAFWEASFAEIGRSRFLRGLKNQPGGGHEHWVATLDWLLTRGKDGAENVAKVWEGRYRDAREHP